jgi:hypothetical protein
MNDLFPDLQPSLSPRLAWLEKHGLVLRRLPSGRFECVLDDENWARGEDEDEAVINFCVKTGLAHYSQP